MLMLGSTACDSGIYTLKFYLQTYTAKYLRAFHTLSVPDASPFEQYYLYIKHAPSRESRKDTCMNEAMRIVENGVDGVEVDSRVSLFEEKREAENFKMNRL